LRIQALRPTLVIQKGSSVWPLAANDRYWRKADIRNRAAFVRQIDECGKLIRQIPTTIEAESGGKVGGVRMRLAIPLFLVLLLPIRAAAQPMPAAPPPAQPIEDVTVEAPRIPQEQAIHNFVDSSVQPSFFSGKMTTWQTGVCPETQGLITELALSVTKRLREVAAQVGASVDTKPGCKPNVLVYFTREPQALLDQLVKQNEDMLGYHEVSQTRQLATIRHPIQAWYATATRDENGEVGLDNASMPCMECVFTGRKNFIFVAGNRAGRDGLRAELGRVTIIGDLGKLDDYDTRTLADYVAMLALSQTDAFATCRNMPSITNLLIPDCDASLKTAALSDADLAFLRGVYKTLGGDNLNLEMGDIFREMDKSLANKDLKAATPATAPK